MQKKTCAPSQGLQRSGVQHIWVGSDVRCERPLRVISFSPYLGPTEDAVPLSEATCRRCGALAPLRARLCARHVFTSGLFASSLCKYA